MTTTTSFAPPELAFEFERPRPQAPRRPAAERRRDIVQAAVESIAAEGLAALRVEDIAQRCGVAKTTVYLYFRTRDELILEAVRWIAEEHFGPLLADDEAHTLETFLRDLAAAARRPAVQAVFASGPALVDAESVAAADLVRDIVARLVTRLACCARDAGAEPSQRTLAAVLVPGVLAAPAWAMPQQRESLVAALIEAFTAGLELEAA